MKKYVSILLAGMLTACVCTGAFSVSAADSAANSTATISAAEVWAKPNETVTVDITVEHNPGIAALSVRIDYDAEKLTLLDAKNKADWKSAEFIAGGDKTAVPYLLNWDSDGTADFRQDGVIAQLQFAVSADASGDAMIGVTFDQGSTFRADFSDAAFETQNGIIHIGEKPADEPLRGDVDSSGSGDVTDAQLALSAYAELMASNPSGLSETAFRAADVDRDGELSASDAQYILQYYAQNTVAMTPTEWEEIIL